MSRQPRTRRTALVAAVAAVILAAAVAVLVHRSGGDGAPAAQAAPGNDRAAQLWHNLAQCLRTHGYPQFKDPVIESNGDPDFGTQGAQVKRAVQSVGVTACRAELAAMPASEHHRPPTAAELHQLVLFARCMRAHGLSDWPDPRADDGTFPLNQRLMAIGKSGIKTQIAACGSLLRDGKGIPISPSSAPPGSKKANFQADGQ